MKVQRREGRGRESESQRDTWVLKEGKGEEQGGRQGRKEPTMPMAKGAKLSPSKEHVENLLWIKRLIRVVHACPSLASLCCLLLPRCHGPVFMPISAHQTSRIRGSGQRHLLRSDKAERAAGAIMCTQTCHRPPSSRNR